jgi:hypothetical protein
LVLPLAAFACLVLGGPALAADLDSALDDLAQLKKATKPRATNEDLIQYLDAVFAAYNGGIEGPAKPADDASEDEKKAYESELAKFEKAVEKFRGDVEKLVLKILTLYKPKNGTNIRDDVNIKAARILGDMAPQLDEKGRRSLSRKLMKAIEKKMTKVKAFQVNSEHLEAAFEALAKLGDDDALMWMNDNYTHGNENAKEYLIAAHKAMVVFPVDKVKGKDRYEIVAQFVKMYSGIELQAEQTSNDPKVQQKKRFWDEIKTYTIPVVQHFAKLPKDSEGQNLSEMKQFEDWLRENKNPRKPPWTEDEDDKQKE